jgi:pimeloyl-ACP methyl ester carboxylesterase
VAAVRKLLLGTGLHYNLVEWDAPGDHTVLLVHGFLDFAYGFTPLVEAGLEGRFHIIAPDLRGHGDSDRVGPGGYYHFADYIADLHDLIQKVARPRLSIVGHSMGGMVASYYAGTFPERVAKLVLVEGIGPPEERQAIGPERVGTWILGWERIRRLAPKTYATVEEAAARLCAHDALLDPAVALRLAEHGTARGPDGRFGFKHDPLHLTRSPYGGFRFEIAERFWRKIACPTLLVDGEVSDFHLYPEEAARRIGCFPHAERATVPGAGHMMHRQKPAELAAILNQFLA